MDDILLLVRKIGDEVQADLSTIYPGEFGQEPSVFNFKLHGAAQVRQVGMEADASALVVDVTNGALGLFPPRAQKDPAIQFRGRPGAATRLLADTAALQLRAGHD